MLLGFFFAGCASAPSGTSTAVSADPVNPAASPLASAQPVPSGSPSPSPTGPTFVQFALTINPAGSFDSVNGFYNICFNSFDTAIDVSNTETFTDFIQYDGTNLIWYNRKTLGDGTIFQFFPVAQINQDLSFSEDRRTMIVTFDRREITNPFNQFIATNLFTANALTTDRQGVLGAVIDTMGQGPDLVHDTLFTYFCDKTRGVINPVPPNFPDDPLNDTIVQGQGGNFPFVNFDISRFEVTVH